MAELGNDMIAFYSFICCIIQSIECNAWNAIHRMHWIKYNANNAIYCMQQVNSYHSLSQSCDFSIGLILVVCWVCRKYGWARNNYLFTSILSYHSHLGNHQRPGNKFQGNGATTLAALGVTLACNTLSPAGVEPRSLTCRESVLTTTLQDVPQHRSGWRSISTFVLCTN